MGHTYSNLLFHVIFGTKDRRPTCHESFRAALYEYMAGVARKEFGRAIRIGGVADHLHALISLRTDVSIADAMRKFKSLSSKWVHKTYPAEATFAWQGGYAAFSVSESNADRVIQYIASQGEHHRRVTFEEEFLAFLDRHGIELTRRMCGIGGAFSRPLRGLGPGGAVPRACAAWLLPVAPDGG